MNSRSYLAIAVAMLGAVIFALVHFNAPRWLVDAVVTFNFIISFFGIIWSHWLHRAGR